MIRRDWEPGDGLLTGPNPFRMRLVAQICNDYLLFADSFDSLNGEFLSNTRTK